MVYDVPNDQLRSIFTPDVIRRLQKRLSQPFRHEDERERLLTRLNILTVRGEISRSTPGHIQHAVKVWRAYKAAWDTYLHAAYACGLLSGKNGVDIIGRLTDTDNDNFQVNLGT